MHGGGMAGLWRRLRRRGGWGCAAAQPERCVGVLRVMRERGLEVRAEDVAHVACAYPAYPPRVRQQQYDNQGHYLAGVGHEHDEDGDNEDEDVEVEEDGEEEDGEEEGEGGEGEGEGEAGYGRAPCRRTAWSEDALLWLTEAAVEEAEEDDDAETVRRRWSRVFSKAAAEGAGLRLLRAIREKRGAAVHLGAVACGGSEEALEWAAAELAAEAEAEGGGPRGGGGGGRGGGGGAACTLKVSWAGVSRRVW